MNMEKRTKTEPISQIELERIASEYVPLPAVLDDVELPASLVELTEEIAKNTHDTWSKARMSQGWTYGPQRDDLLKKHPDLLPYSYLTEEEKKYDRASAMNAIKFIVAMGYAIQKKPSQQETQQEAKSIIR